MLYHIQIQGRHAPRFFFKDQHTQNFKSLLDGITSGNSVVISAKHRTDIIFQANDDHLKEVFKLWSLYLDRPISDDDKRRVTVRVGREAMLEHFFSTLVAFSKMKDWYQEYLEEFKLVCELERSNAILHDLLACEQFLQKNKKTIKRPRMLLRPFIRASQSLWSKLVININSSSLN